MNFENKSVIITGAAQGIGFEIAKELIERGARVVLNDVDSNLGQQAQQQLGDHCVFIPGDAGDLKLIDQLIDTTFETFGTLDFAIANAGITTFGPFLEYQEDAFQQLINLNIKGTFFLCQRVAKALIEQKKRGKIILLSSTTGQKPHDELEAYGMTKAAIAFMAKSLGTQLAPKGINVNCISPGATATERTMSQPDYEEGWDRIIPTRRISRTTDIAAAALFLLSEGADQITGQNIIVDGGWVNLGPMPDAI
ncbi:SDR family NAD(P)-dependent oxidoreductase [Jiulongibacter sediminis]|jgi:3-oxoacyl-[acyl-carrier protein] reductase|uniref:SDR family NAD(P)-dependent oxidoreductase n=1 Tax=Jiulongibacter sediminis TaxID=1605367 RepID=UPI0026F268F8|nr:SDR family oxidoreductase [Jiulongibacter sediminis]